MKVLNVGIIGYGFSGRIFHGAILSSMPEFKICKIVTTDEQKKTLIGFELPGVRVVETVEEIFTDEAIDLVIVSTLNESHVSLAEAAMRAGKDVVVEKPFTVTSDEARHLVNVMNETGRVLSVYQNRRYDGDFKTIQHLIAENTLGRIVELESHFDRFRPEVNENKWRESNIPGSGLVYDLGAHLIDQALCAFGMPEEIYADIRKQRRGPVPDNFEIILYYPELKVTLKVGMLVIEPQPRFILQGTKGSYVKYGLDIQETAMVLGERPGKLTQDEQGNMVDTWGLENENLWGVIHTEEDRFKFETKRGDYREYYYNVYNAIVNGEPLAVTAEDGYNVIRLIEIAIKSNEEKRRIQL